MMKKIRTAILTLVAIILMAPTAHASTWDSIRAAGGNLWDTAKDKAAEAVDTAREKGPGWVETAKDAAGNAVDAIKENGPGWVESAKEKGGELVDKAGDALHDAQEKVSSWNQSQQDEFWERTENMINGENPTQPAAPAATPAPNTPAPAPQPTEAPQTVAPAQPAEVNPPENGGVVAESAAPVEPQVSGPAEVDKHDTIMFYDGHWYREVSEGGELYFNDKMFVRDDSLSKDEPRQEADVKEDTNYPVWQIVLTAGISSALSAAIVLPIVYAIMRRRH